MTVENWDSIYNHNVRWALRRCEDLSIECYHDTKEDWFKSLQKLNEFEDELFKNVDSDKIPFTFDEWLDFCHKYINEAKEEDNYVKANFFFHIWYDGCNYFEDDYLHNFDYTEFLKPATKEEIEQARKDFGHVKEHFYDDITEHDHTFSDDAKVLEYRGIRFILDNEWYNAWIKTKSGSIKHFELIWDWYYPIDRFISLEM